MVQQKYLQIVRGFPPNSKFGIEECRIRPFRLDIWLFSSRNGLDDHVSLKDYYALNEIFANDLGIYLRTVICSGWYSAIIGHIGSIYGCAPLKNGLDDHVSPEGHNGPNEIQ